GSIGKWDAVGTVIFCRDKIGISGPDYNNPSAPFPAQTSAYNLCCRLLFARSIVRSTFTPVVLLLLILVLQPFSSTQRPSVPPIGPPGENTNPDIPSRAQKEMEKKAN